MRRARAHTGLKVVPLERAVVAFAVSLHEIKTGASTWRRRSSDSGFAVALPRPVEDLGLAGRTGSGRGRTRPGLITAEPVDAMPRDRQSTERSWDCWSKATASSRSTVQVVAHLFDL